MGYRFQNVKRYKRGASLEGVPLMCTRCRIEVKDGLRGRNRRATVTATIKDGQFRVPVAYCTIHTPEGL